MSDEDLTLPAALTEAHALGYRDAHYFEPDDRFDSSAETTEWWRSWTNDPDAGPAPFRVFGRDSAGGLVAFWRHGSNPIVFLGSEGEIAVLARDLPDYLWLLANGMGPLDAAFGPSGDPAPIPELVAVAQRHTDRPHRSVEAIRAAAEAELPALLAYINATGRE
ncbi:SMI1/KNR4 family protein [Actinoplanes sp. CA-054009]